VVLSQDFREARFTVKYFSFILSLAYTSSVCIDHFDGCPKHSGIVFVFLCENMTFIDLLLFLTVNLEWCMRVTDNMLFLKCSSCVDFPRYRTVIVICIMTPLHIVIELMEFIKKYKMRIKNYQFNLENLHFIWHSVWHVFHKTGPERTIENNVQLRLLGMSRVRC
jgi:hypothetical protein